MPTGFSGLVFYLVGEASYATPSLFDANINEMQLVKKRKYASGYSKSKYSYKRPRYTKAARKIQRWFRKRKPLYKRWLKSDAKRNTAYGLWLPQDGTTQNDVPMQTLQAYRLDMPMSMSYNGQLPNGNRTSNEIFVKGLYIDVTIVNHSQIDANIHMAILQDQHANSDTTTIKTGFFRDNYNGTESHMDFYDTTTIFKREYDKFKINTDNRNVIVHKQHYMKPSATKSVQYTEPEVLTLSSSEAHAVFRFRKYFSLHRFMNFNRPSDVTPEKPVFLCFWWVPIDNYGFNQCYDNATKVCSVNTYFQWIYKSL